MKDRTYEEVCHEEADYLPDENDDQLADWQADADQALGETVVELLMRPFGGQPICFCDRHGYTAVTSAYCGQGFAGGRIYGWTMACGCSSHDESDDVAAAI